MIDKPIQGNYDKLAKTVFQIILIELSEIYFLLPIFAP
nr:MAG TPA: hypothetical protein [Caudoviricetes sp.]